MERVSFKSGCVVRVAKHLKGDWFSVAVLLNYGFVPLYALKCKGRLTGNFKCVCIAMCSLVISLFSRDHIKTEID